ncbi:1-phosphofructokinase [Sphingobium aromaticiconvertens]|uniref:1-phosphofructokinase n=1 Tax=Sphingobium aromaticiconvertens TaxID=365341 RepID=UPI00301B2CD3
MRALTVTFNPAIDQTITIDRLEPGAVHRARSVRQDAGGKGVNVASCLADWGVPVSAFGLLGADNGAPFEALFAAKGIKDHFLRRAGATRVNLKLLDAIDTTDINMDGAVADPAQIEALVTAIEAQADKESLILLCGSLPPGCPTDIYARMVARLRAKGAMLLLDASGPPLAHALKGNVLPHILKPNRHELEEWHGAPLHDVADVARVAGSLLARGVKLVVVSMGEDGALFLAQEGTQIARLTADAVASTVGAGDAMVAGIAAAIIEGSDLERIARLSTAFAVAKLGLPGPHLPDAAQVRGLADRVNITAVEQSNAVLVGEGE